MRLFHDPHIDPADSVLGLLQRGRGDGWRLAVTSGDGPDLLRTCLASDPRWDRQVESRADYYASLAIRLGLAADELFDGATTGDEDWLQQDVALTMAKLGCAAARQMVVEHAWDHQDDQPEAVKLAARSEFASAVATRWTTPDAPLETFLNQSPRLPMPRAWRHRLSITTDPAEIRLLRVAASDPSHAGWRVAMEALAMRHDASAVTVAATILALDEPGSQRAGAFRYLTRLPAEVGLPLAREWWDLPDGRGAAARSIMGSHAEPIDEPAVRRALGVADHYYDLCDLTDALGRLPERGPFPELDVIYAEVGYSHARARAVQAMVATDPDFSRRRATECLWDCEEDIVEVGVRLAPPSTEGTRRINELA